MAQSLMFLLCQPQMSCGSHTMTLAYSCLVGKARDIFQHLFISQKLSARDAHGSSLIYQTYHHLSVRVTAQHILAVCSAVLQFSLSVSVFGYLGKGHWGVQHKGHNLCERGLRVRVSDFGGGLGRVGIFLPFQMLLWRGWGISHKCGHWGSRDGIP